MAFKKNQKQGQQKRQSKEPDGKMSLWVPDDSKKYVISGKVNIGDEVYRVFIYENNDPLYDNSPEYYGSLYLVEEEEEAPRQKKSSKFMKKTTKVEEPVEEEEEETDEEDTDYEDLSELPF